MLDQENTTEEVKAPDIESVRSALAGDTFELEEGQISDDNPPPPQEEPKEPVSTEPPATDPPSEEYDPNPLWDEIKSEYEEQHGEGTFVKPEGITPENERKLLLDFLSKNVEPSLDDIPDDAKEIIELHKKGAYNPEEFFKQRSPQNDYTKLPDKEFLFTDYKIREGKSEKNEDGVTDEEIDEFLSKKTKLELREMARSRRDQITQARESAKQKEVEKITQTREQRFQETNENRIQAAQKVVNQHKDVREYYGIEFTPQEDAQFKKDFVEMVKLNKETGRDKIAEMLNDDTTYLRVAAMLWKGEEKLKGYMSDLKEGTKRSIEEKLDPALEPGKGSTKLPAAVDREKLI